MRSVAIRWIARSTLALSLGAWGGIGAVDWHLATTGGQWPPGVHSYILTAAATGTLGSIMVLVGVAIADRIARSDTAYHLGRARAALEVDDTPSGRFRRLRAVR